MYPRNDVEDFYYFETLRRSVPQDRFDAAEYFIRNPVMMAGFAFMIALFFVII